MIYFIDNHRCDCGTLFEWKTFFLQSSEAAFGRWDDMQKNVINQNIIKKAYHITVRCPKCGKTYLIVHEK